LSGGPFLIGTDATTIFWAGNFNDNDPQVFNGNAALAAYIEGKGESNWMLFAINTLVAYDVKDYDGARLKFDYTESGTPVLTYFNPTGMSFGETPVLHVYGTDLDAGSLDKIQLVGASTYDLTSIVRDSATHIHGTVPAGVAVGNYIVRARIAAVNYDAPGSFSVSSAPPEPPTITKIYGDDNGSGFVKHRKRWCYAEGTNLGTCSSMQLQRQDAAGTVNLTSVSNVNSTKIKGWLEGPIPPGTYKLKAIVAAGTIYSMNFRISLGPATW